MRSRHPEMGGIVTGVPAGRQPPLVAAPHGIAKAAGNIAPQATNLRGRNTSTGSVSNSAWVATGVLPWFAPIKVAPGGDVPDKPFARWVRYP